MVNKTILKTKKRTKLEVGTEVFSGLSPIPKPHTGGYMADIKALTAKKK